MNCLAQVKWGQGAWAASLPKPGVNVMLVVENGSPERDPAWGVLVLNEQLRAVSEFTGVRHLALQRVSRHGEDV